MTPARISASPAKTVAAYIAAAPPASRRMMTELRRIVRSAAPQAEEVISYRMPAYKYHGMLVAFAAFARHVGFYAISTGIRTRDPALARYKTGKGSVQFPLGQKLPAALIRRLVRQRVAENEARAAKRLAAGKR